MAIKSEMALEMLKAGQIQELMELYQDDIYQTQISKSGGTNAKKRYAAMKRFYKFIDSGGNDSLKAPGTDLQWGDDRVNVFLDRNGFVATKENIGEIKPYRGTDFFDVGRYFINQGEFYGAEKLPATEIIAEAKTLGYKPSKGEIGIDPNFFFRLRGWDWKVSQLDRYFSIINDGDDPMVYFDNHAMYIHTEIGTAMLLPLPVMEYRRTRDDVFIVLSDENTAPYEQNGWQRVREDEAFDMYNGGPDGMMPNHEIYITADNLTPETWGGQYDRQKYEKARIYDEMKFDAHQRQARQFLGEKNGYYLAYYVQM